MAETTIFAWTELTPRGSYYPAYVRIARDEHGKHTITVRARDHDGQKYATAEISPEALESLLCDLAADLYRDGGPAPSDKREHNLHLFLSAQGSVSASVTVQDVLDNWKTDDEQNERGRGMRAFINSPEVSAAIAAASDSAGNAGVAVAAKTGDETRNGETK